MQRRRNAPSQRVPAPPHCASSALRQLHARVPQLAAAVEHIQQLPRHQLHGFGTLAGDKQQNGYLRYTVIPTSRKGSYLSQGQQRLSILISP